MAKKKRVESIHDRDRIIIRLPDGMRDQLTDLAEANGRSLTAEVVAALERHLKGVDRVTEISETLKKYQPDIEQIDILRQAVLNLEYAMEHAEKDFRGVLTTIDAQRREQARVARLPPITVEQADYIRARIKETGIPEHKLLKALRVSTIEEIKDMDRVMWLLESRREGDPPA